MLLLGGAGLYAAFSNYSWVDGAGRGRYAGRHDRAARAAAGRQARTTSTAGCMLGRSYAVLEQYPLAMRAYQRADRLANGSNVEAIIGIAEVAGGAGSSKQIRGARRPPVRTRAASSSPTIRKALFYSAFAALARGELPHGARTLPAHAGAQSAAAGPRHHRDSASPSIDAAVQRRRRAPSRLRAGDRRADRGARHAGAGAGQQGAGGRTLFVAARDPQAPGPPFAVKRLPAQFPVDVELTAADAMMASRRIAAGQQLEVVARVALGGTPTATSGDPFGQVSYHVGKDGRLNIVIDRLAP